MQQPYSVGDVVKVTHLTASAPAELKVEDQFELVEELSEPPMGTRIGNLDARGTGASDYPIMFEAHNYDFYFLQMRDGVSQDFVLSPVENGNGGDGPIQWIQDNPMKAGLIGAGGITVIVVVSR